MTYHPGQHSSILFTGISCTFCFSFEFNFLTSAFFHSRVAQHGQNGHRTVIVHGPVVTVQCFDQDRVKTVTLVKLVVMTDQLLIPNPVAFNRWLGLDTTYKISWVLIKHKLEVLNPLSYSFYLEISPILIAEHWVSWITLSKRIDGSFP